MALTTKDIQDAVRKIDRIEVEGTGCMPQHEHHQIADEAMGHVHTVPIAEVQAQWAGWGDMARACEIVAKKHSWDINYCFEAITYTPVMS